ncbi:MAG: efflux RND transporter periplasmic adaptor subunit [Roseovarius sp.]|nr:efflux RND transporter periplasmic adaptor subunit [Roseovarius sp.]
MRGRYAALSILAIGVSTLAGVAGERYFWNPVVGSQATGPEVLYWVAPMDANYRRDGPGKSPMGMDLVPVYAGQEPSGDPSEVRLSAPEINAIGVRTAIARMETVSERIETVGYVGYDDHLTSHVHTRVEGWVETLNVRAVGDQVAKGDVLFEMFSPVIGSSSADLIRAIEAGDQRIVELARSSLRSQGMSDRQIDEIASSGRFARNLHVYAPQDGVVISLEAADGMFLQPNTRALSLTDPSRVWLIADVFERDIGRLSENMTAVAEFDHLPGSRFEGRIDYIYPELDARTRTLPVRLRFDNRDRLLRTNMFGTVVLVPDQTREGVTVPSEAIIRTGQAERIILKIGEGTFKPRLITTGLRDAFGEGGRTEVLQGLAPGEEVVASAQFLIDSESALSAGLMRMAPSDVAPARGRGTLVALDPDTRMATLRHDALEALDWPAMTSRFPVRADIAIDRFKPGQMVVFHLARGADGQLGLIDLGGDDGIAATATGLVAAVTHDGKLTMRHDAIPAIGWPAMQMDMSVAGLDPATVPLGERIEFDLAKGEDGGFVIVAVRAAGTGEQDATGPELAVSVAVSPITVPGRIEVIHAEDRTATIAHGPIPETGMPGMTMRFGLAETLDPATLGLDTDLILTFARPDGVTMVLTAAEPAWPPMHVPGTINAIDRDAARANISHGPIADIGMPGMTMDFAIAPELDTESLPVGREIGLLLARNPNLSLTLVGVAPAPELLQ